MYTEPLKPDVLNLLEKMAKLSRLAYHSAADANETLLLAQQANTNVTVFNQSDTGAQGLVVISHATQTIDIAYCGTQNLKDWGINIKICKRSLGAIEIHRGVRLALRSTKESIALPIEQYPTYSINLTGHSLGGMCATAACVYLEARYNGAKPITLVTFGAGKIASSKDITKAITTSRFYSLQNGSDAVPRRPNLPISYGHHTGPNHTRIYFPNKAERFGHCLVNPSEWITAKDRAFSFFDRVTDHNIEDYEMRLAEAAR